MVAVVAEPNTGGELGDGADEPEVAAPFRSAGFAGHGPIGQGRSTAGSIGHYPLEHPQHGVGDVAIDGAAASVAIHPPAPEQFAIGAKDLLKWRRFDVDAAVVDGGIGGGHVEQGLLVGANGQGIEAAELAGEADAQTFGGFNHLVEAQLLQQAHRHRVERVLHRPHQGDRTEVAVAEVARAVAGKASGLIHHDPLGAHPLFEGCEINKQLEGGSRRAQGIHGAVELALGKVLAAHHRPHQAGARFHRHQGPLHIARGVGVDGFLGLGLPGQIQAAFYGETTHFQLLFAEHLGQFLLHPAGEIGRLAEEVLGFGGFEFEGRRVGLGLLSSTNKTRLRHAPQHHGAALEGEIRIHQGGIDRGRWRQASYEGCFAEGELGGGFGEVDPGRIGHAIGAGAEVHHIEVLGKDLLLAELALEFAGEGHLRHFAEHGALLAQEHRAGKLLGNGAAPFLHGVLGDIAHHGPADTQRIDAVVLVETAIFRGNKCLLNEGRHGAGREFLPGCRPDFLHHLAVGRKDGEGAGAVEGTNPTGIGKELVETGNQCRLAESNPTADGGGQQATADQMAPTLTHITPPRRCDQ